VLNLGQIGSFVDEAENIAFVAVTSGKTFEG
jgi:hypothetical protein